jgi:hypothetical protein
MVTHWRSNWGWFIAFLTITSRQGRTMAAFMASATSNVRTSDPCSTAENSTATFHPYEIGWTEKKQQMMPEKKMNVHASQVVYKPPLIQFVIGASHIFLGQYLIYTLWPFIIAEVRKTIHHISQFGVPIFRHSYIIVAHFFWPKLAHGHLRVNLVKIGSPVLSEWELWVNFFDPRSHTVVLFDDFGLTLKLLHSLKVYCIILYHLYLWHSLIYIGKIYIDDTVHGIDMQIYTYIYMEYIQYMYI